MHEAGNMSSVFRLVPIAKVAGAQAPLLDDFYELQYNTGILAYQYVSVFHQYCFGMSVQPRPWTVDELYTACIVNVSPITAKKAIYFSAKKCCLWLSMAGGITMQGG